MSITLAKSQINKLRIDPCFPDLRLNASTLHDVFLTTFICNLIFTHFTVEHVEFTNEFRVQTTVLVRSKDLTYVKKMIS